MLFNSFEFLFLFLPITLLIFYFLLKNNYKKALTPWLAIMSLLFYSWWEIKFTLILLVSICFNYLIAYFMSKMSFNKKRKLTLGFGITVNLLLLAYYKYFNFFIENIDHFLGLSIPLYSIVLPIGISFFTFTQIAFLVDVYRGFVAEYRFVSYVLFVTFFPHLIAGPILHHKEMMPQFEDKQFFSVNWQNICIGSVIFFLGLFKKTVIADNIAIYANPVFNAAAQGILPDFFSAWIGALSYSLQLYFDFSAYSDMAIGISLLFNIKLPVNFFSPYKATSIIDFWRRWHMTLSNYLKNYVYIPLGGSKEGQNKHLINLMLTMLIGGLWHGAGWTFIFWGFLHGAFLITNHLWRKLKITIPSAFSWLITFISVVVAWVFFRATTLNEAIIIIKGMVGLNGVYLSEKLLAKYSFLANFSNYLNPHQLVPIPKAIITLLLLIIVIKALPNVLEFTAIYKPALRLSKQNIETKLSKYLFYKPSYIYSIVIAIIAVFSILSISKTSEFLYFQF